MKAIAIFVFSMTLFSLVVCAASEQPTAPTLELTAENGLPDSPVVAIAQLPDGSMAFGTSKGLAIYHNGKTRIYTGPFYDPLLGKNGGMRSGNTAALRANRIQSLAVAHDGSLWIGTDSGLARLAGENMEDLTPHLPPTWPDEEANAPKIARDNPRPGRSHSVRCLFRARDGRMIIGTRNAGVIVHDPAKNSYALLHRAPDTNKWVNAIDQDKQGTLWLAVRGEGVLRAAGGAIEKLPEYPQWVPLADALSLRIDHDDSLWVATPKGLGVRRSDGSTKVFTSRDALPQNLVTNLSVDRRGRIWAFTNRGVTVFDAHGWSYPVRGVEAARPRMQLMFCSSDHDIWIADQRSVTRNPVLEWSQQNPASRAIAEAKTRIERGDTSASPGFSSVTDSRGRTWLSISHQIFRYDGKSWAELTDPSSDERQIYFMKADSKKRVWIGTVGNGLFIYDGDEVARYNGPASVVYDMSEAGDGTFYVGTEFGIYTLSGTNWEQKIPRVQAFAVLADAGGRIWFGNARQGLMLYEHGSARSLSESGPLNGYVVWALTALPSGKVRVSAALPDAMGAAAMKTFECDGVEVVPVNKTK